MIFLKIFFSFILMISGHVLASTEPSKTLTMVGGHAPIAGTQTQAKKQVHFKDAAEYVEPAPLALQATPMATATGTLTSPVKGACTAVPLAPLATLYKRRFGQGHSKQQAKDIIKTYLPIILTPTLIDKLHVTPYPDFLKQRLNTWNQNTGMWFREQQRESQFGYKVEEEAYIKKDTDYWKLYILPKQENIRKIEWHDAQNHFVTFGYTENFYRVDTEKGSHTETRSVWDFNPFEAFTEGIIGSEQLMLISLLHDIQKNNHVPLSLSDCAVLAQEPGITTAELARVLLTFHPALQDHILKHMHISTKKSSGPNQNQTKEDEEQQPEEDYLQAYQAFEQARDAVLGQTADKIKSDAIHQELEEFIVDERPNGKDKRYVKLFMNIRNTDSYYQTAMVELADAIQMHDLKRVQDNLNYRTIRGSIKFVARMCCGETSWASIPLLHEAIKWWDAQNPKSNEIFKAILHYQERLVPDSQEWKAYKYSFKDALEYALELKQYNCATQIAQKMMLDPELRADAEALVKNQRPLMAVMAVLSGSRK